VSGEQEDLEVLENNMEKKLQEYILTTLKKLSIEADNVGAPSRFVSW
jgi:hypothetical protein